jgi:hypothetical protein
MVKPDSNNNMRPEKMTSQEASGHEYSMSKNNVVSVPINILILTFGTMMIIVLDSL